MHVSAEAFSMENMWTKNDNVAAFVTKIAADQGLRAGEVLVAHKEEVKSPWG